MYENAEDYRKRREYFDIETDAVLRQAIDPKLYNCRPYIDTANDSSAIQKKGTWLHFRVFTGSQLDHQLYDSQSPLYGKRFVDSFIIYF